MSEVSASGARRGDFWPVRKLGRVAENRAVLRLSEAILAPILTGTQSDQFLRRAKVILAQGQSYCQTT